MSARSSGAPFSGRVIVMLVAAALVGLIAFLLLSAYADDLRPQRMGGVHVLSNSGVGYSGAAELIRLTGGEVTVVRDKQRLRDEALMVLTPGPMTSAKELRAILELREDLPTLIVLPKYFARPMRGKPAWAESLGQLDPQHGQAQLAGTAAVQLLVPPGDRLRGVKGDGLFELIGAPRGALLAQVDESELYILADADALNNHGLATAAGVERATKVLEALTPRGNRIAFDATLAGFGRDPNLLKLAFEPPFLPLTLCLLLAALLAVFHALRRFGPAALEERKLAFGKRALADNGAALLRLARRRHRTGGRYATLTREAVAAATGAPAGLSGEALDRYLDRLSREGEPFTAIAARAESASDTRSLLSAARALYFWRRTVTRDHR